MCDPIEQRRSGMTSYRDRAYRQTMKPGTAKEYLRKEYLAKRDAIPQKERHTRSTEAVRMLKNDERFLCSKVLLAYYPIGSEVDICGLLEAMLGRKMMLALPISEPKARTLEWHSIKSLQSMHHGWANIPEPPNDPATLLDPGVLDEKEAIAIIPGVVFDTKGRRIGYGGGYYDRFLADFRGAKIGMAFREQIIEDLRALDAVETHDIAMDSLIVV